MTEKQWYKPREFAEQFNLQVRHVYAMIRDGRLQSVRIGKLIRIPSLEVTERMHPGSELNVYKRTYSH